jgi:hypothetical protein
MKKFKVGLLVKNPDGTIQKIMAMGDGLGGSNLNLTGEMKVPDKSQINWR